MVFLADKPAPMDTQHQERALRPIPVRPQVWLVGWTDVGAWHAGILRVLLPACMRQGLGSRWSRNAK